jgi:hypothetical protein
LDPITMTTAPTLGRRVYRFLASLWLTLIILTALVAILIYANRRGYDLSMGALRRDFYGSWWFNALLGLLMVNLVACTVIRKPWRFWQWGFLVTHTGVLTLMVGAGISFNWKIYGHMSIPEGGTVDSFEVEGERELVMSIGAEERRHPLRFNPYDRSRPDVRVPLPSGLGSIRIAEYVPNVAMEDTYGPDPNGRFDVVEVKVHLNGRQEGSQWVAKGATAAFNRLSFAYRGADEPRYRSLTRESSDQGTLAITIAGETKSINVQESLGKPHEVGGRTVTIRERFGSLTLGDDSKPMENPLEPDANPALVFDVEKDGKADTYYVYALFPEHGVFRKGSGMHQSTAPDFTAEYRLATRVSRFWIFAFPEGLRYVLTTEKGITQSGPLRIGERIKHPVMPMDFQIEVSQHFPKAEPTVLAEEVKKGRNPMPAIRVAGTGKAAGHSTWLRMFGEPMRLTLPNGVVDLRFEPRIYTELGVGVHLVRFKNPPHPGTGSASKFESELKLTEADTGRVIDGTTGVNYPFTHKGWSFYQSAFNDKVTPVVSTLQVSYDPGKPVLYLGCIMVVSGTVFMLFLKPLLLRLVKAAKGLGSPRLGPVFTLGILLPLSAGTIAGMATLLAKPLMSSLLVGSVMAAAGLVMAFSVAAAAVAGSRSRPGVALGVGRIVSLTWCLNTAALVILMWTRVT